MKIIILMIWVTLMLAIAVNAETSCDVDYSNAPCNVTTSFAFHTGTYYCPSDDCFTVKTAGSYVNTNGSTFYGNDSNGNGAIIIGSSNSILDCGGGWLIGNKSTSSKAIASTNFNHIYIQNCKLTNYARALSIAGGTPTNFSLFNNEFYNFTTQALFYKSTLATIQNNTFFNNSLGQDSTNARLWIIAGNNVTVKDNKFYGQPAIDSTTNPIYYWNITNNLFDGLVYSGSSILDKKALNFNYFAEGIISNNNFTGYQRALVWSTNKVNNTIIQGNLFYNNDEGIFLQKNVHHITIQDNIFDNQTTHLDGYDLNIEIENGTNFYIWRNNFTNIGWAGITLRKANDSQVINNSFDFINISDNEKYYWEDWNDPRFAIGIIQDFKSYLQNQGCDNNNNDYGCVTTIQSYNINISGNTFDNDTQVFLKLQGASNIENDLSNYWYRKFTPMTSYSDYQELYINNLFSELSHINNTKVSTTNFWTGYNSAVILNDGIKWSISKTLMTFKNVNPTTSYNLSVYNLSSPNNDIYNSTGNFLIANNVNSYTLTINSNEEILVGDYQHPCQNISNSIYNQWNPAYENGLVAWYRFDSECDVGESDSIVYDYSGNGNNGSVVGAVANMTGGKIGGAYQFDGNADYVKILDSNSLDLNDTFTIAYWAKENSYRAGEGIISKYKSTGNNRSYRINTAATNETQIYLSNDGITGTAVASINLCGLRPNYQWEFFSVIYNSTHLNYYKNGNFCNSRAIAVGSIFNSKADLYIGYQETDSLSFNGSIDEVIIWNRSLSNSEVLDIYNQQNANCVNPYEDINITQSTTLCSGSYNLNDTTLNGAILIGKNDIDLTCNNTNIYGNSTTNSRGIYTNYKNVTIRNCNVSKYGSGLRVDTNAENTYYLNGFMSNLVNTGFLVTNDENLTIYNNTIDSPTATAIDIQNTVRVGFYNISYNTFIRKSPKISIVSVNNLYLDYNVIANGIDDGIVVDGGNNVYIRNNNISNMTDYPAYTSNVANLTFSNNIFSVIKRYLYFGRVLSGAVDGNSITNTTNTYSYMVYVINSTINITSNTLDYSQIGIIALNITNPNVINLNNNKFLNMDIGIYITRTDNSFVKNNQFFNMTRNVDAYNLGIYAKEDNNLTMINNTVEYGHIGIWVQKSTNISIYNTTCNQINIFLINITIAPIRYYNRYGKYSALHYYEPTACILLGEQYEGWVGDSTESSSDNIDKFRRYNVTDVVVNGITANGNVQTYLHTVGVFGTQDYTLPSYWYRKFWIPTDMTDADEFFNNNEFSELSIVPANFTGITTTMMKSVAGMWTAGYDRVNYTISKTSMTFKNVNDTLSFNLSLYNLSSPNNDIYNSSGNFLIAANQNSYTLTINSNEEIIVGNYGDCSAGQTFPSNNTRFGNVTLCGGNWHLKNISVYAGSTAYVPSAFRGVYFAN